MRIALITQEDPLYLPPALDALCRARGREVIAVVILPAFNERLTATAQRHWEFYGPIDFVHLAFRYLGAKLADRANRVRRFTRPYSSRTGLVLIMTGTSGSPSSATLPTPPRGSLTSPERGDGLELYKREVKPAVTDLATVGAHYALCSLFDAYAKQARVYCYQVQAEDFQAAEAGKARLVVGRAQVTSEITLESDVFGFAALHLGNHNLNGGVKRFSDIGSYETMAAELTSLFAGADFAETIRALDRNFRGSLYTLKSLFRDDQGKLLGHILRATLEEAEAVYRQKRMPCPHR